MKKSEALQTEVKARVSPSVRAEVEAKAAQAGISVSEFVRRAVVATTVAVEATSKPIQPARTD